MKMIWIIVGMSLLIPTVAEAKKRTHVVVQKQYQTQRPVRQVAHPLAVLAFVAPPLLVFYDLDRRINCYDPPDPLGLGGPGFDSPVNPNSTVMIPACARGKTPQPYPRPIPTR